MEGIVFLAPILALLALIRFIGYAAGKRRGRPFLGRIVEIGCVFVLPLLFLAGSDTGANSCCGPTAIFSPGHRAGIYLIIFLCAAAYGYATFRRELAPPLPELIINCFLVIGIALNVLLCLHLQTDEDGPLLWSMGNIPIILLFVEVLHRNYRALRAHLDSQPAQPALYRFLATHPLLQWPLLTLLAVPVLLLITLLLYLFGQQPDTLIRAFTDTYKHGFSQLDYQCDNVQCGGHYLCSVAANGHRRVVGSFRYGRRQGARIVCNRQLLVSNAFEELLQERLPRLHRSIRRRYNHVGNFVHRYYGIFENPFVSDAVYLLMKPAEWLFVLVLYSFDRRPEDRIARQYTR